MVRANDLERSLESATYQIGHSELDIIILAPEPRSQLQVSETSVLVEVVQSQLEGFI